MLSKEKPMKKSFLFAGLAVILLFMVVGCANPGGSAGLDFVGTWQGTAPGQTVTFVLTATSFSATAAGVLNGSLDALISEIDTGAKHFVMTQTSAAGIYDLYPNGTILYATYDVAGNVLHFSSSTSGYPSAATAGPYYRQ
jgi:hypothetical protein